MNLDLNGQDLMLETQSHVYCFHQDFLYHKSLLENRLDIHFVDLSLNKKQKFLSENDAKYHHLSDREELPQDRKSTRLNSSHVKISYAVFCLKKKKKYNK